MPRLVTALCLLGQLVAAGDKVNLPSGFSKWLFYDDFSTSGVDRSKWHFDVEHGYANGGPVNWGTGEVQVYSESTDNVRVSASGTLQIVPQQRGPSAWTSGRIETMPSHDFACRPFERLRVQVKFRLGANHASQQQGIWPAIWMLGADYRNQWASWPQVGEVDLMESVNGQDSVRHTVHCGTAPDGVCNEYGGIGSTSDKVTRGEWHTVAWEVDRRRGYFGRSPEFMTWSIDGVNKWTLTQQDQIKDDAAWLALVENPKMLLLNVAVGGSMPDAAAGGQHTPNNATRGGEGSGLEVDYVAVWSSGWWW